MRDHRDRDLERMFALDDVRGPARPLDDARSAAIIAGALRGAGFPPVGGGGGAQGGGSGAAKGLAAGKLTVIAGGVALVIAGATWLALRSPSKAAGPAPAPVAIVAPPPAPAPLAPAPSEPPPAVAPSAPADELIELDDEPVTPSRKPPRRPGSHSHRRRHPEPAVAAAEPAASPQDLLADANAARAAHRWRAADALYARVIAGGSADLAAQTALVASASLHLEHLGDPPGAARRFSAALAAGPRDALAEDARWGLVEAARAQSDTAGELRALDDFVAHHPGSPLAGRARARRTQLGASP